MRATTSCSVTLALLGVLAFASPAASESSESQSANTGDLSAHNQWKAGLTLFSPQFAGTFVVSRNPEDGPSRILTIFADGNLSSIQSIQFGQGVAGGGFSDQRGAWKRHGRRKIQATVLDFSYDPLSGDFLGPSVARYLLQFDKTFQSVIGTVSGKIFSPGIDPLNPGEAVPIGEFGDAFEAHRVTVGN